MTNAIFITAAPPMPAYSKIVSITISDLPATKKKSSRCFRLFYHFSHYNISSLLAYSKCTLHVTTSNGEKHNKTDISKGRQLQAVK